MKRDHVTSILCFDRKINVLPIFNLQGAVADVLSCWYSAVMDGSGVQDKDLWTPDWIPPLNSLAKQLTELAFVVAFLIHLTMHKRTELAMRGSQAPPWVLADEPWGAMVWCWKHFLGGSWEEGKECVPCSAPVLLSHSCGWRQLELRCHSDAEQAKHAR